MYIAHAIHRRRVSVMPQVRAACTTSEVLRLAQAIAPTMMSVRDLLLECDHRLDTVAIIAIPTMRLDAMDVTIIRTDLRTTTVETAPLLVKSCAATSTKVSPFARKHLLALISTKPTRIVHENRPMVTATEQTTVTIFNAVARVVAIEAEVVQEWLRSVIS